MGRFLTINNLFYDNENNIWKLEEKEYTLKNGDYIFKFQKTINGNLTAGYEILLQGAISMKYDQNFITEDLYSFCFSRTDAHSVAKDKFIIIEFIEGGHY